MKTPQYQVYNDTDGILASPDMMSLKQAEQFVQDFPNRFKSQGYYQTVEGLGIDPKDVMLSIIQVQ